MAEETEQSEEQRAGFPVIPMSQWWKLRDRFKRSIPPVMDAKYLSVTLNMNELSAKNNILPSLRAVGLVDESGKTDQKLAARWRDDTDYPTVCKEMVARVYPAALTSIGTETDEDKAAVKRWFGSHAVGASAISKASAVYFALCDGDPTKAAEAPKREQGERKPKPPATPRTRNTDDGKQGGTLPADNGAAATAAAEAQAKLLKKLSGPQLHLNVQIHISPETTPEQIESIFASMAKHLKQLSE